MGGSTRHLWLSDQRYSRPLVLIPLLVLGFLVGSPAAVFVTFCIVAVVAVGALFLVRLLTIPVHAIASVVRWNRKKPQ